MINNLRPYFAGLTVFLILDALWLWIVAKGIYEREIGHLLAESFQVGWALFYPLYLVGILVFVVTPAKTWKEALKMGALFGLIAYATYDLTNYATLRDWPLSVTLMDMLWWMVVTAAASVGAFAAKRK